MQIPPYPARLGTNRVSKLVGCARRALVIVRIRVERFAVITALPAILDISDCAMDLFEVDDAFRVGISALTMFVGDLLRMSGIALKLCRTKTR